MRRPAGAWQARISIDRTDAASTDHLERVLRPESAREVPRTRARIVRSGRKQLAIDVDCEDAGALRAGMNAFLGWIDLALRSEQVGRSALLARTSVQRRTEEQG
ncbi:MAG: hypothetical protein L3J93_00940 [Thermoplasmata archaeon]|nr:hypothetical protein [Thermoplasmata archaeon]